MKKSIATATFPINALMDAYNYDTEEECKEYLFDNNVPYDLETTLLYVIETKDFSVNSDRIRRVFLDYYKEKKNSKEIARDMNISSSRVSELIRKCKFIIVASPNPILIGLHKWVEDQKDFLNNKINKLTNDLAYYKCDDNKIDLLMVPDIPKKVYTGLYDLGFRTVGDVKNYYKKYGKVPYVKGIGRDGKDFILSNILYI